MARISRAERALARFRATTSWNIAPEKFGRFLALLLGGDLTADSGLIAAGAGSAERWTTFAAPGVFELLLQALADRPAQLNDLRRLVQRLETTERGQALLPEGFLELWKAVDQAHREAA